MILAVAVIPTSTAAPTPRPTVACPSEHGVTPTTVKVGIVYPKTGPARASFADFDKAVQLRFDQENAKGGVNGRKFQTVVYDDQGSGAMQTTVATKAVQGDDVFGVVSAGINDTMFPIFKRENLPVTGLANQPPFGSDRNVFGATGASDPTVTTTSNALRLKEGGATKIAVLNHTTPASNLSNNSLEATLPLEGLTKALRLSDLPTGSYDATSTALRVKASGADGVYENVYIDGGVSLAQAFRNQGYTPKIAMLAGLVDPGVVQKAGGALEGVVGTTYGTVPPTVDRRSVKTYVNGMKAGGLNPYSAIAPVGFVSAELFIRGMKEAGTCLTRTNFIEKLRLVTNFDGKGMLPAALSYKPGLTPNGDPARCSWFNTAKGSTLVADAKPTCGKFVSVATGKIVG